MKNSPLNFLNDKSINLQILFAFLYSSHLRLDFVSQALPNPPSMMATALSAQLAQIAAKSSNPLDLKAQKRDHSQSLIFDEKRAANQGFETIYQICLEGFQELCQLEPKYTRFARSIFSAQSQTQDRNQMTQSENQELDGIIDSFLCLVSAKLLLKPAHLAIEWLVRRFRLVKPSNFCLCIIVDFKQGYTSITRSILCLHFYHITLSQFFSRF